jgi:hypothetical protein
LPDTEPEIIQQKDVSIANIAWFPILLSSVIPVCLLLGGVVWFKKYPRRARGSTHNAGEYFMAGREEAENVRLDNYLPFPEMIVNIDPHDFRIENIELNSFANENHDLQPSRPAPEPPLQE